VEIGTEATQFPEKENIHGIFVAVQYNWKGKENVELVIKNLPGCPEMGPCKSSLNP
jgi:hypothetical protein